MKLIKFLKTENFCKEGHERDENQWSYAKPQRDSTEDLVDAQKLAKYLSNVFNSTEFKALLDTDFDTNRKKFAYAGNQIINYAIATRDFSRKGFEELLPVIRTKEDNAISKQIVAKVLEQINQHDGENALNTDTMKKVFDVVYGNCQCGGFYTHSFSGALIDSIDKNGLDASQEMFTEEFQMLDLLTNPEPSTRKRMSRLCLTPASDTTFYYAIDAPERLSMKLSVGKRQANENLKEYYHRMLAIRLDAEPIPYSEEFPAYKPNEETLKHIREAGEKICDFYGNTELAAIAIIPKSTCEEQFSLEVSSKMFEGMGPDDFYDLINNCTDINNGNGIGIHAKDGKVSRQNFAISELPLIDNLTCEKIKEQQQTVSR